MDESVLRLGTDARRHRQGLSPGRILGSRPDRILAAGLLFWCVTRAFNGKRPLLDLSAGLLMSSLVFLIFGVALNVPLPSGILGGL